MNWNLETLANHPLIPLIGWTLIHFVWQAILIAALCAAGLQLLSRHSARLRYLVACFGLLMMVASPIATSIYLGDNLDSPIVTAQSGVDSPSKTDVSIDGRRRTVPPPVTISETGSVSVETVAEPMANDKVNQSSLDSIGKSYPNLGNLFQSGMPWLVSVWGFGVLMLSLRLGSGLIRIHHWKRNAHAIAEDQLLGRFNDLAQQMNCRRVQLFESANVAVPAVIGWLKPVVLVPSSMISGLNSNELESILAHELAHVRRYDFLINLLQSIAETLLFYHPAVWWISKQIRIEREYCCDDLAAEVCGGPKAIAVALAKMEQIRCQSDSLVMAADGGSLVARIRRLVHGQTSHSNTWWPVGVVTLAAIFVLTCWIGTTDVSAEVINKPASDAAVDPLETDDEDDYPIQKSETVKTDSKTGIEKRVFNDIQLTTVIEKETQKASLDMMYSNVMMHTFIPARIAKKLNATVLGEIDFGKEAPPRPQVFQTGVGEIPPAKEPAPKPDGKTITVHELTEPLGKDGKVRIVPYLDEPVWVPGHLGFYGMNQTKQHIFKVVRIQKVDLGIGPAFGPINALVLDDENSDFGVLGRNWTQQVRGKNGETLWFNFDGTFHLKAHPNAKPAKRKPAQVLQTRRNLPVLPPPVRLKQKELGSIMAEPTGIETVDPREMGPDLKVFATQNYSMAVRTSTGWITIDGTRVPVDHGVQWDGVTVYVTLMFDVVAVDKDEKVIWQLPWGKTQPIWQSVSIVDWVGETETKPAIELFCAKRATGDLIYQYHDLKTGKQLPPPKQVDEPNDQLPRIHTEREGNIDRAFIDSIGNPKSATETLVEMSPIIERHGALKGSVTNMETLVSAYPRYLIGHGMDADTMRLILPNHSKTRIAISGEKIELWEQEEQVVITLTNGKVELLGPGGVVRATASADGGAEKLKLICRKTETDIELTLRVQVPPGESVAPPVQIRMNLETGAPKEESTPPHGSTRYEIFPFDAEANKPVQFKMKKRWVLTRLADEAEQESGKTWEQLIFGEEDTEPATPQTDEGGEAAPWQAHGLVTNTDGQPLEGVTVKVHCGIGTLRETGSTTTDKDGKYVLDFGPGVWSTSPTLIQAATVSVSLAGHCEQNLHRQGDLVAAKQRPEGDLGWGGKTDDQLFLPGKPLEVNFVMVPSTSVRGTVFQNGTPVANMRVSITGDELPPSSSVIDAVRTDAKGQFAFKNVPTGYDYQIVVQPNERGSPWPGWATPPIKFAMGDGDGTFIHYKIDGTPVDFSFQYMNLLIDDEGINWKKAIAQAAKTDLKLSWNGLQVDNLVRASDATIELK